MVLMTGVPPTIANGMQNYHDVFFREAGYEHVSRYVSGLVLSKNKTLQAIHAQQVWPEGKEVSRSFYPLFLFDRFSSLTFQVVQLFLSSIVRWTIDSGALRRTYVIERFTRSVFVSF